MASEDETEDMDGVMSEEESDDEVEENTVSLQKISEEVFLISWKSQADHFDLAGANATIAEISHSIRLYFRRISSARVLEMEINPDSSNITDEEFKILKPSSVLALAKNMQTPMVLHKSMWTAKYHESFLCDYFNILIYFDLTTIKTESKRVLDRLLNLWETRTLADVTFKFNDKEVIAHTCIMASSSPVFSVMFQRDFKEKEEKVVEIRDIKSNVFEKMLRYIYSGNADLDNVDVADLLIAADKYGIDALKEDCELYLSRNLNLENIIYNLQISYLYQTEILKKLALEFMAKNAEFIVLREDWADLVMKNPKLSIIAMKSLVLTKK